MLKKALILFAYTALTDGLIGWSYTDNKLPAARILILQPSPALRLKWTTDDSLKSDRVALVASIGCSFCNTAAALGASQLLARNSFTKVYSRVASDPVRVDSKAMIDYFTVTIAHLKPSPTSRETIKIVLHIPQDRYPRWRPFRVTDPCRLE